MISRRKCGRRGEDTMMDNDDGDNNAQTQQSNSTHKRGEEDGSGGDNTYDNESLEGVAAVSLMSDADASGDKVFIYDEGGGGKFNEKGSSDDEGGTAISH
jgi:hypothetical protein